MGLLRRVTLFSGKGPLAIVTAGIVGTSVSLPKVIKNVDPNCLPVADQVRSLVTDRWRNGEEKNVDTEGIWNGALEIDRNKMGMAEGNHPCYLFLVTYGGVLYHENSSEQKKEWKVKVTRDCQKRLWDKVHKSVKGGWGRYQQKNEKNGKIELIKTVIEAIDKLKEGGSEKIKETMKKVQELSMKIDQTNIVGGKQLKDEERVSGWFYKNFYTEGTFNGLMEEVGDDFERKVTKIIHLEGKSSEKSLENKKDDNKIIQKLQKTPSFCATT